MIIIRYYWMATFHPQPIIIMPTITSRIIAPDITRNSGRTVKPPTRLGDNSYAAVIDTISVHCMRYLRTLLLLLVIPKIFHMPSRREQYDMVMLQKR